MSPAADGVRRLLVTAADGPRLDLWAATGAFANWIEAREGVNGTTYFVTVLAPDAEAFLAAARAAAADDDGGPVTVQELHVNAPGRSGESLDLLVGDAKQGWVPLPREPLPCGCVSHDPADHQGGCGHCGAGEDEHCEPGCPVDGSVVHGDCGARWEDCTCDT